VQPLHQAEVEAEEMTVAGVIRMMKTSLRECAVAHVLPLHTMVVAKNQKDVQHKY
jgi:sulfur carrier protein ThiS